MKQQFMTILNMELYQSNKCWCKKLFLQSWMMKSVTRLKTFMAKTAMMQAKASGRVVLVTKQ